MRGCAFVRLRGLEEGAGPPGMAALDSFDSSPPQLYVPSLLIKKEKVVIL